MNNEFPIPGAIITREDVALIIFMRLKKIGLDEAREKADALTDTQMEEIAEAWSQVFFEKHDGLFARVLEESYTEFIEV
jgi:hypothetical protein